MWDRTGASNFSSHGPGGIFSTSEAGGRGRERWGGRFSPEPPPEPHSWELHLHHQCFSHSLLPGCGASTASIHKGAKLQLGIWKLLPHCSLSVPPSHKNHGLHIAPLWLEVALVLQPWEERGRGWEAAAELQAQFPSPWPQQNCSLISLSTAMHSGSAEHKNPWDREYSKTQLRKSCNQFYPCSEKQI